MEICRVCIFQENLKYTVLKVNKQTGQKPPISRGLSACCSAIRATNRGAAAPIRDLVEDRSDFFAPVSAALDLDHRRSRRHDAEAARVLRTELRAVEGLVVNAQSVQRVDALVVQRPDGTLRVRRGTLLLLLTPRLDGVGVLDDHLDELEVIIRAELLLLELFRRVAHGAEHVRLVLQDEPEVHAVVLLENLALLREHLVLLDDEVLDLVVEVTFTIHDPLNQVIIEQQRLVILTLALELVHDGETHRHALVTQLGFVGRLPSRTNDSEVLIEGVIAVTLLLVVSLEAAGEVVHHTVGVETILIVHHLTDDIVGFLLSQLNLFEGHLLHEGIDLAVDAVELSLDAGATEHVGTLHLAFREDVAQHDELLEGVLVGEVLVVVGGVVDVVRHDAVLSFYWTWPLIKSKPFPFIVALPIVITHPLHHVRVIN